MNSWKEKNMKKSITALIHENVNYWDIKGTVHRFESEGPQKGLQFRITKLFFIF